MSMSEEDLAFQQQMFGTGPMRDPFRKDMPEDTEVEPEPEPEEDNTGGHD